MKLIIAGTRTFTDHALLKKEVEAFVKECLADYSDLEVISGFAKGADTLGEAWGFVNGIKVKIFPPDWNTHGKAAGPIRNKEMATYATHCIIFWDGKSKGTKSMIDEAVKNNLVLKIVKYETPHHA